MEGWGLMGNKVAEVTCLEKNMGKIIDTTHCSNYVSFHFAQGSLPYSNTEENSEGKGHVTAFHTLRYCEYKGARRTSCNTCRRRRAHGLHQDAHVSSRMTNDKPRTRSQHDIPNETESPSSVITTDAPEQGPRTRARAAATTHTAATSSAATSSQPRRKDKGKNKQIEPDTRPAKRFVPTTTVVCTLTSLCRPRRSAPASTTVATATTSTSLSINEPKRDPKGKKRAAPDPDSDDAATSSKKHKSPYTLRNRTSLPNTSKTSTAMPRKNRYVCQSLV
jgi:hypothetical protein